MTFTSNAQNFEDVLLWRALHDVSDGRYIDIGAHDPVVDSVSLAFYQAGWRGLHVEPVPTLARILRESRPEETIIEAAVSDEAGPIAFYELDGLSSGIKEIADRHARNGNISRQTLVPTVRLDELLKSIDGDIHWLKIDVEGMEADVIRSWGSCEIRPWILVIEATIPNTQVQVKHLWIDEILKRGYVQVFFDGLNCYFVHEDHRELGERFAAPPNIFDGFTVTANHFTARPLGAALQNLEQLLAETKAQLSDLSGKLSIAEDGLDRERACLEVSRADLERAVIATDIAQRERNTALKRLDRLGQTYLAAQVNLQTIQTAFASEQVEKTRFEERSTQLQKQLEIANQSAAAAQARIGELQAAHESLRVDLGQRLAAAKHEHTLSQHRSEQIQVELARLNNIAEAAALTRPGRWQRLGEALGLSRQAPALKALSNWQALKAASSNHHKTLEGSETTMHASSDSQVRNPYLRANSLAELLSWEGSAFLSCAYVTVLGRRPDSNGEVYYLNQLQVGNSKMDVLWQLRKSPEAASHDPGIAGFDRALRNARFRSWLPRTMRRAFRAKPDHRPEATVDHELRVSTPSPATDLCSRKDEAVGKVAAELAQLRNIVDGMGHALKGLANAQASQEQRIASLLEVRTARSNVKAAPSKKRAKQFRQLQR